MKNDTGWRQMTSGHHAGNAYCPRCHRRFERKYGKSRALDPRWCAARCDGCGVLMGFPNRRSLLLRPGEVVRFRDRSKAR